MKYRIVETHTPRCGIIFNAEVKRSWFRKWEDLFIQGYDSTYRDTLGGQEKKIGRHIVEMNRKYTPLKRVIHKVS